MVALRVNNGGRPSLEWSNRRMRMLLLLPLLAWSTTRPFARPLAPQDVEKINQEVNGS